MNSERKIEANRRNAQRSTGPRSASGKMRVRRNALRHGLAALVIKDPLIPAEVDQLATAISSNDVDGVDRQQALIMAGCEVTLRHVRVARAQLMEQLMMRLSPTRDREKVRPMPMQGTDYYRDCIEPLRRLERYERRALSRRRRVCKSYAR